jgi:hypothetical protein
LTAADFAVLVADAAAGTGVVSGIGFSAVVEHAARAQAAAVASRVWRQDRCMTDSRCLKIIAHANRRGVQDR